MAESPDRVLPTLLTTASTTQTVLTAAGASTWNIVRSILVANELTIPVAVTVGLGTSNTDAAGKRLVKSMTVNAGEVRDVLEGKGFLTMKGHASTPDLIYALCDNANGASVTISYVSGP